MKEKKLIYDGTFEGFLSCVFYTFEYKLSKVTIQNEFLIQHNLFAENETIITDKKKSDRVWSGLKNKTTSQFTTKLYYAFLSEQNGVENILLDAITYIFKHQEKVDTNFTHPSILSISNMAKNVSREKHRMEAFVRFKLTKDGFYFANIEPDFNVLPLIKKHFKSRYADQKWIIYDIKRNYGLFYDLEEVTFVNVDLTANFNFTKTDTTIFSKEEFDFQNLWQEYFKSTNIKERKNLKLHKRHIPTRYWKYLSEKQPKI